MILSSRSKGLLKGGWIAVLVIALWGSCNYKADVIYTMDQLKQEDAAPSKKDAGQGVKEKDSGKRDTGLEDTGVEDTGVAVEDVGVADTGVVDTGTDVEPEDSGGVVDSGHAPDRDAPVGRGIEIPEGFILNPKNAEASWFCASKNEAITPYLSNCQLLTFVEAIQMSMMFWGVAPFFPPFDQFEVSISIEYPWTEGPDAIIFVKGVPTVDQCGTDGWWYYDYFSLPPAIRLCENRCNWYLDAMQTLQPEDIRITVGYLCVSNLFPSTT